MIYLHHDRYAHDFFDQSIKLETTLKGTWHVFANCHQNQKDHEELQETVFLESHLLVDETIS
jgi:hypothetical protein